MKKKIKEEIVCTAITSKKKQRVSSSLQSIQSIQKVHSGHLL